MQTENVSGNMAHHQAATFVDLCHQCETIFHEIERLWRSRTDISTASEFFKTLPSTVSSANSGCPLCSKTVQWCKDFWEAPGIFQSEGVIFDWELNFYRPREPRIVFRPRGADLLPLIVEVRLVDGRLNGDGDFES